MIGRTVSHYRISEQLGAGGMGVVYGGEDVRLGRRVAIKFLTDRAVTNAGAFERFQKEARLTRAVMGHEFGLKLSADERGYSGLPE